MIFEDDYTAFLKLNVHLRRLVVDALEAGIAVVTKQSDQYMSIEEYCEHVTIHNVLDAAEISLKRILEPEVDELELFDVKVSQTLLDALRELAFSVKFRYTPSLELTDYIG